MQKQRKRLLSTCRHEAGHCVAALVLGFDVDLLSVAAIKSSDGRCLVSHPFVKILDKHEQQQVHRNYIVITFAGPSAERLFDRKISRSNNAAVNDTSHAVQSCRKFGLCDSRDIFDFLPPLMRQAEELVGRYRNEIESVANGLCVKTEMTGDEILAMIPRLVLARAGLP